MTAELLELLRQAELALTMPVQGFKTRTLRNGNDDRLVRNIRAALAKATS